MHLHDRMVYSLNSSVLFTCIICVLVPESNEVHICPCMLYVVNFVLRFIDYRIFFHKALVAIFWRELRGNHPFELLASCSIDGNVLIDTEVAVAETTPSGSVKGIDDSESPATGGAVEMMQWQYRNPSIKTKNEKTVSNSDCGGISCKPKDLQAVLSVSLANTIWRYDASMYWYFLLSICVNISWILSLFFFRDKLTYQGHTGRE